MRRGLLRLLIIAVGLLWGLTASQRTDHVWVNERQLWTDAVQQAPRKPRPWVNLGNQYGNQREYALAAEAYRTASHLSQQPGRSREEQTNGWAFAETNLALLDVQAGDIDGGLMRVREIRARVQLDSVLRVEKWLIQRLATP